MDLITTDDSFNNFKERFEINFKNNKCIRKELYLDDKIQEFETIKSGNRYLRIKVRREELIDVISNQKPWEDLSNGFSMQDI